MDKIMLIYGCYYNIDSSWLISGFCSFVERQTHEAAGVKTWAIADGVSPLYAYLSPFRAWFSSLNSIFIKLGKRFMGLVSGLVLVAGCHFIFGWTVSPIYHWWQDRCSSGKKAWSLFIYSISVGLFKWEGNTP